MKLKVWLGILGTALLAGCTTTTPTQAPIDDRSRPIGQGAVEQTTPAPAVRKSASPYFADEKVVVSSGRTHAVARGETLYSIGVRYGVDPRRIAQLNNVTNPAQLAVGTVLQLPEGSATEPRIVTNKSVTVEVAKKPERTSTTDPVEVSAAKQKSGVQFDWPVNADVTRIIGSFNQVHTGIDIEGAANENVSAVMAGEVFHVAQNAPGYGNFVILRHAVKFPERPNIPVVTVYGNLGKIAVAKGDKIAKGGTVGQLGADARLRFEIRNGVPLDPMRFLKH